MIKSVCVFTASSNAIDPSYFLTASRLGSALAKHQLTLVYGGTEVGLMGAVASSVHKNGGKVIGIIPQLIKEKGIAYYDADQLIVTKDLRERKALMSDHADAFMALPGGFGTLEELLEVLTLKQLGIHNKPVILLDINNFFEPFDYMVDHLIRAKFVRDEHRQLYHRAKSIDEAVNLLLQNQPINLTNKWTAVESS